MSRVTDQHHLRHDQYKNAGNLDARAALHRRYSTNPYGLHRWIFDHIALPAEARVLELGCGPGWLWQNNLDRIPSGWDITLTDFSPGMVKAARENLARGGRMFGFRVVDAQDIPLPDATFDAVIANHMLYHVPDRQRALTEIHRVLKPGGILIASTIGDNHNREMHTLMGDFEPALQLDKMRHANREFTLQNGREQIMAVFPRVARHDYDDNLAVTDVAPLVDYVYSLSSFLDLTPIRERRAAFTAYVADLLAAGNGTIHITKESGLFLAHKSA